MLFRSEISLVGDSGEKDKCHIVHLIPPAYTEAGQVIVKAKCIQIADGNPTSAKLNPPVCKVPASPQGQTDISRGHLDHSLLLDLLYDMRVTRFRFGQVFKGDFLIFVQNKMRVGALPSKYFPK